MCAQCGDPHPRRQPVLLRSLGGFFWMAPGPFKEVEDHLSLPFSSLGWKLVFLRPVIHSCIPIVPTLSRGLANILMKLWLEDSAVLTVQGQVPMTLKTLALNPLSLFSEGPFQLKAPLKGCWPVQEGSPSWLII